MGGARTSLGTRLACATKSNKFEKEGKAYIFRWKSSRTWLHLWLHRTRGYGRLSRWQHALHVFASLGTAVSRTHCSWRGLHGVVAAFMLCLLFHFHTRFLALPRSHRIFFHFDVKPMRPLVPLQCWEQYSQAQVGRMFAHKPHLQLHTWSVTNCIPKAGWKSKPHPPTKNTHCKISSPKLRRLAKMVSNK